MSQRPEFQGASRFPPLTHEIYRRKPWSPSTKRMLEAALDAGTPDERTRFAAEVLNPRDVVREATKLEAPALPEHFRDNDHDGMA